MIFSVIVPFLNEERRIEKCIRSLIEQDFDKSEYEIIFIDNNSTDRSAEIVRGFPRVTLLTESRQSSYAARNKGIQEAKGAIIAFTDADCAVSRDWLARIHKVMEKSGAAAVLGRRHFPQGVSFATRAFEDYENAKIEYCLSGCRREKIFGYTNNMAVRSEIFKELGSFATSIPLLGDGDFVHRIALKDPSLKIAYVPEMVVTHLEVTSAVVWLEKIRAYGKDMTFLKDKNSAYTELSYKDRARIYYSCATKNGYGFLASVFLLFLLILGNLFYQTGKASGYIKRLYPAEERI
jgi:glycosyltransferase involved in cell wall biosynthesis